MPDTFHRRITAQSVTITFSSTLENIDRICGEVSRFLNQNFKELAEHFFAIDLVIREALTNAVRHGNNLDPAKKVKFFLKITKKNHIQIIVEDQGQGFDWQTAKNFPPGDDNDHGRGLAIMTAYFSTCGYNKKGNRLVLEKKLPPIFNTPPTHS
jgi:serine/threonine-protein kinase RsbW